MTLYVCWRALDRTEDIVQAVTSGWMQQPLHGAITSPVGGTDNVLRLTRNVATATALLWIVGPYTLDLVDEEGRHVLWDADDTQHMELTTAVRHAVPVVVVRYQAPPLTRGDLPRDLKVLADAPQVEWCSAEASLLPLLELLRNQKRTFRAAHPEPAPTPSGRLPKEAGGRLGRRVGCVFWGLLAAAIALVVIWHLQGYAVGW